MADPVTAAAAASAPAAVGSGISAVLLVAFGVGLQELSLGLAGAVVGLTFAPKASPVHWLARFFASAIVSAVIGSAVGQQLSLTQMVTRAVICCTGALFYPALDWAGKRFGRIADAGAKRVGIDVGEQ